MRDNLSCKLAEETSISIKRAPVIVQWGGMSASYRNAGMRPSSWTQSLTLRELTDISPHGTLTSAPLI
jgi:hypothetical protein